MLQEGYHARIDFKHPLIPESGLAFGAFDEVLTASQLDEVGPCLARVQEAAAAGKHAVGFIAFEAAPAFDSAFAVNTGSNLPLLFFGIGEPAGDTDLPSCVTPQTAAWQPSWTAKDYESAFRHVQDNIRDGNTYQINLTFPLLTGDPIDPMLCYSRMKAAQSANYSGFLQTPEFSIVSSSPELFFSRSGNKIATRPMKGTRPRGATFAQDQEYAEQLRSSRKDQAENVIIVDLLRNDLGRIAKSGSVRVPKLFAIEKYPTVWQMTSVVEAELEPDTSLFDIFTGIFPCGSVTGAPKVKTMEIIAELEDFARGVYCGAFGVVLPGGDCVFNVPIRTMTIFGDRAVYPVGSGVVSDSDCAQEYDECLVKAKVLTRMTPQFQLLETMLWQDGWVLLDEHMQRARNSADYFDYPCNIEQIRQELHQLSGGWTEPMRVRLLINRDGSHEIEAAPLREFSALIAKVKLADEPISSKDIFLYHKTTARDMYNRERKRLGDADEAILFNERGELTEGTISNVALKLDGVWYTPPVHCGLLGGTLRQDLLARGEILERVLTKDDYYRAEGIRLMNSVRGFFDVDRID